MPSYQNKPPNGTTTGKDGYFARDAQMPQSLEAERAVLGSILIDNSALGMAEGAINKDDFFSEGHRLIFERIRAIAEKSRAVDLVTLAEDLSNNGLLEKVGGAAYLSGLTNGVPVGTYASVREYAGIVKRKSILRRIIYSSNNAIARALEVQDEPAELLEIIQEQAAELEQEAQSGDRGPMSMRKVVETASASGYLGRMFEGQGGKEGVLSGLVDLDSVTRGFHASELTLIAARPSSGKSALAFQVAALAAKSGTPTGLFSIEMTREAVLQRLVCSGAMVDSHKVRTGFVSREECARALAECAKLMECPLYLDDSSALTVAEFASRSRRLKSQYGVRMVIVDYLQLVTAERKFDSREQEVSYIGRSLKRLAKSEGLAVVACAQLNRESERGLRGRAPKLSDLRESGSLEQEADLVIFIHKPRQREENGEGQKVELIVGKQRNGPTGTVPAVFLKRYTKFDNVAPVSENWDDETRQPYKD